jgi:hypothetical protein
MTRVLDEGGLVWEGKERYIDLDDMLADVDEGIAQALKAHGLRG